MQLKEVQTKKGKAWEVTGYLGVQPNGKRKKVQKRGFANQRVARAWFNNEVVLFENGESQYNEKTPKDVLTVRELYDIWLKGYQDTVEESTLAKVLKHFDLHILPRWGDTLTDQIKPVELQEYLNTMQAKILSYKKVVRYFNQLTRLAVKLDMIEVARMSIS